MRRALIFGLLVVLLVAGTASAAPSTTGACETADETVVLHVEGGEWASTAQGELYPGSTVYVGYCDGGRLVPTTSGDTVLWAVAPKSGLSETERHDQYYELTVPSNRTRIRLNASTIERREPTNELSIDVQQGPTVQSRLIENTLRFRYDRWMTYDLNESEYVSARDMVRNRVARLNETAAAISGAEDVEATVRSGAETLEEIQSANATAAKRARTLRTHLYERLSESSFPPGNAVLALQALETSERDRIDRLAAARSNYRAALQTVHANTRTTILKNMAAGLVIGLLVGGIGGGYRIREYGRKTRDFSDFGGGNFDRSLLTLPAIISALFLLGALAVLMLSGLWGVLL